MKHIENERWKLLANALDRGSTACITIGVATPLAGAIYNVNGFRHAIQTWELAVGLQQLLRYILQQDVPLEV